MRFAHNSGEEVIRVLVADNTRIHTQLLADALRRDRRLEVVGSVSHGRDLLGAAASQKMDVGVISSHLDEEPRRGIEILRELRGQQPEARFIILLDSSKRELVLEAFRAGARGLFSRHHSLEILCKCVRRVYEGQVWASSEQVTFAVEALAATPAVRTATGGLQVLSKRELDVVHGIVEGLTNREIAARLNLSQHTIKNYLFRVFDKLGVSSRLELMSVALVQSPMANARESSSADAERPGVSSFAECKQAAEQGVSTAQAALAEMYQLGEGTSQDPVSAYAWYLLSEQTNLEMNKEVAAARQQLAETLTGEQILEAQNKAAELSQTRRQTSAEKSMGAAIGPSR